MTLAAVPRLDIFLWSYQQIQLYQTSVPDMHVLRTEITLSTKKATSHTSERARAEAENRLHVLRLTKEQTSEVLITNFVPISIKCNKFYHLFFNKLDYIRFWEGRLISNAHSELFCRRSKVAMRLTVCPCSHNPPAQRCKVSFLSLHRF
jgi:hypothetical protein